MWKKLLVISMATAGLALAAAVNADARGMGGGGGADVGFQSHAVFNARAESREPNFRPHGWSEGRKTGWHCRVGARGCIPPGLR
jgi:hypothetical protein